MSFQLHVACCFGKKSTVKKIVDSVPNVVLETKNEKGRAPLWLSVAYNQVQCATLLLKAGVHVDSSDKQGWTALHVAAFKGHYKCVKLLLLYNASCQQQDISGVTPLHLASINSNPKNLVAILKAVKPGGIDIQDNSKKTALHWSASYSLSENLEQLLLKGANACIPDEEGKTPLHWAALSAKAHTLDCVRTLLDKERSLINWQDYQGRSALHLAIATGHAEVVHFLASQEECNVDILDNAFCTPLHWAAKRGLDQKIHVLLNEKASNASADENGACPLHYAAYENHAEAVKVFLSRKYSAGVGDTIMQTACVWAAARNSCDVLKVMRDLGINMLLIDKNGISVLHAAAIEGHWSIVELLLNLKFPVDLKDKYGMSAFLRSCEYGRSKTALILMKNHASVFMKDSKQRSALHWCALGGHAHLCQMLLHKGLQCNSQDSFGMTPLHCACAIKGSLNCASVLLEWNADCSIADINGYTSLHWAILNENYPIVRLLCEHDVDVNAMVLHKFWVSPLDLAISIKNDKIRKLLKKYGALQYEEIQDIAAYKIQGWYRSCKFQENKLKGFIKSQCLEANVAFLRRCQDVINSSNQPAYDQENSMSFISPLCFPIYNSNCKAIDQTNKVSNYSESRTDAYTSENLFVNEKDDSILALPLYKGVHNASRDKSINSKELLENCGQLEDLGMHEEVAAHIIQRAWRKVLMKKRFIRMRLKIQTHFETTDRSYAENIWHSKLQSFLCT